MKIILALALAACSASAYQESSVDARIDVGPHPDAAPDSSITKPDAADPPHNQGCPMGNLPLSRTKTYVDGDPVDPQILNELQDNIVSGARNTFSRVWTPNPTGLKTSGVGSYTYVTNPSGAGKPPTLQSTGVSGTFIMLFPIQFQSGDIITGISAMIYGEGTADGNLTVFYSPDMNTNMTNIGQISYTNAPATWTAHSSSTTAQPLVSGASLWLNVETNVTGFCFGEVSVQFQR